MCRKRGFTLIELLVVVLIIGILAAIAVPQYQMAVYKAHYMKAMVLVHKIVEAEEAYYMANGSYARDSADLDLAFPPSCKYEYHSDWAYDLLLCPEATIHIQRSYGGVKAEVKKCPRGNGYCNTYKEPFLVHHAMQGHARHCGIMPGADAATKAFGEKFCLSLGGKKETDTWGDKYYF